MARNDEKGEEICQGHIVGQGIRLDLLLRDLNQLNGLEYMVLKKYIVAILLSFV